MLQDTDKTIQQIKIQNPGIPIEQEAYIYCNNKIPTHKGIKDLQNKPNNNFNSIAINTNKSNYMCIDFDGYSTNNDKTEKQEVATKIKDNFVQLLNQETKKYRIDKTASNKYHIWLKHPNVKNKEFLKLDKFLTLDGKETIKGIVEVFSKFDKHNVHLAGSTISYDDGTIGTYENIYAGASFDKLDEIPSVKALLTSAIISAGYLIKIEKALKVTNTIQYYFLDATHNGNIKEFHRQNKIYFSYLENDIEINKHFYVVDKNDFNINHIMNNCLGEFKSILCSIYYYHQENMGTLNKESNATIENQEISKQLIEVYKKYWNNTRGNRHNLMFATSHVLIKYLDFNDSDLDFFFDELSDAVDDIDIAHRTAIKEGLESHADKEYGIPTIIDILDCGKDELTFLAKDNVDVQHEMEHLERIKPTLTDEIIEDENLFQEMYRLQQDNYFDGLNTYLEIKATNSVTDLIAQTIGNMLLNENTNIARLLLAFLTAVIGNGKTFIIVTGVSSGGKSAIVGTVKMAIPNRYLLNFDDSSDKAFIRYVQNKGEYAYDRIIIDIGDKGNMKGFEENKERMGEFQNLITKDDDSSYNYHVTNKINGEIKGTDNLTIKTNGFVQVMTTTKDAIANFDEQLITRSQILYVANNSYNDISNFQAELGKENVKNQAKECASLFKSHILYQLNKHNNLDTIIVAHWKQYIKDLLIANNGVEREIEYTMNVFRTYCWLEIDRLEQVKGNDDIIYYIPGTAILCEFIRLYGVKSSLLNDVDVEFIKWLKSKYENIDAVIDDSFDLNIQSNRNDANVFIYKDIETLLKSEKQGLYKRINNVSDILRKLEKCNILNRLADNTRKGNVIYHIQEKQYNLDKTFELLPISDANVTYAIEHLKEHERIETKEKKKMIFGKLEKKFNNDIDFKFIDQRNLNADAISNNNRYDDNDDSDANVPGNTSLSTPGTIVDETLESTSIVNLHCHTDESVGDGAISINKLIDTAIEHEQKAIALTNHGTLNGLYKFNNECRKKGIKAILGIEAYITKKRYHLILLAKNYQGYQDLLTLHNKNVEYMKQEGLKRNDKYVNGGIYYSNLEQEKELCKNLIGLSGCISGEIPTLLLNNKYDAAKRLAITYNTLFNQFYLELQYNGLKKQEKLNELLIELSNDTGIPLTVTGDVHYISNKDDWNAIKYAHRKGSKAPASNNAFMTKAPKQLAETTITIADSIASYNIETSLHIPKPKHKREWLRTYCYDKLKEYGIDDNKHKKRLEKELQVIKDEIADYHILLYEIVENIRDVAGAIGGRGSAVGSLVCYLLGFHEVDPLKYDLLFERYLNKERIQKALKSGSIDTALLPDIDINIASNKRDEIFAILENKYKYISKVMTYSTLKVDNKTIKTIISKFSTANVIDLKYNISKHAGGIILSTEPFNKYLPVTLSKDNEIITDCTLAEVEARGGIKYDLLGESSSIINDGVTLNDKEINQLIKYLVKHPMGISQFTGHSARTYLRTHNVKTFDDLVDATALIRTGSNESWIFQEDMMQQATRYGVTLADADFIRKPRGNEQEKQQRLENIIKTMVANGCSLSLAESFKEYHKQYSFNKSHAVAYTLESLKNAKLKRDNTALFFERRLNHHFEDKLKTAELFNDAIQLGVHIIPPDRKYYLLDAKADGNKLHVGTKFINDIKTALPITNKGFKKPYKLYLRHTNQQRLYMLGAYDKHNLPGDVISLGYEKQGDNYRVATISGKGFNILWLKSSKFYKAKDIFCKGAIISDEFIHAYSSTY